MACACIQPMLRGLFVHVKAALYSKLRLSAAWDSIRLAILSSSIEVIIAQSFLVTISHLLDLGQHCNQLFKQADILTKNKLLRFIVPANIYLYDKQFLI